jgi:hypothetical protein
MPEEEPGVAPPQLSERDRARLNVPEQGPNVPELGDQNPEANFDLEKWKEQFITSHKDMASNAAILRFEYDWQNPATSDEGKMRKLFGILTSEYSEPLRRFGKEVRAIDQEFPVVRYQRKEGYEERMSDLVESHRSDFSALFDDPEISSSDNTVGLVRRILEEGLKVQEAEDSIARFLTENSEILISISRRPEELNAEELIKQLDFRYRYFQEILGPQFHLDLWEFSQIVKNAKNETAVAYCSAKREELRDRNIPYDQSLVNRFNKLFRQASSYDESQIVAGALLFQPGLSTAEFLDSMGRIINNCYSPENKKRYPENSGQPKNAEETIVKAGIVKQIQDARFCPWLDKKIFEVGGSGASRTIANLGAVPAREADAGHSVGYTSTDMIKDEEKVMHLGNYQRYGAPHGYDMICSAQLFDIGSGIGKIAEPSGSEDRDTLGEEEMLLIMINLLKEREGYMIHDESIHSDLPNEVGVELIGRLSTDLPGNNLIRIYRTSGRRTANEIQLGKKRVVYNKETKTWELAA